MVLRERSLHLLTSRSTRPTALLLRTSTQHHHSRRFPFVDYAPPLAHHRSITTTTTSEQQATAALQPTSTTPLPVVSEIPTLPSPPQAIIDIPSPLWYHRLSPLTTLFSRFSSLQRRRPLLVTLLTSLTTYLLGDLLAQELGGEDSYNPSRTLRMLIIGGLASIPGYRWFLYLGSHFNHPTSKTISIAYKVAIQQFVFAPLFNTYFFGMQAALSGEPPSVIIHRIQETVPQSVVSSAKFWPVVTAVNFAVVPAHLRFMVSGGFAVVWQTYLSFVNRRAEVEGPRGGLVMEGHREIFEVSVAGDSAEEKTLVVVQEGEVETGGGKGEAEDDDDEKLKVVAVAEESLDKSSDSITALVEAVVERVSGSSEDGPVAAAMEESVAKASESVKEIIEEVVEKATGSSDEEPESPLTTTDGKGRSKKQIQAQSRSQAQSVSTPVASAASAPPEDAAETRSPTRKETTPRKEPKRSKVEDGS